MDTLLDLHKSLATKFVVPIMGGKALDLHRLFVEVTARGGLEKVIRNRQWKEIIAVFSFPSTITNASFVLRKYYLSLLNQYEQVYYFRKQVPPSVQLEVATTPSEEKSTDANQLPVSRRRNRRRSRMAARDPFHPKPNRSGYNFFYSEHYARLKSLHRGQEKTISTRIAHLWSKLTEAEKQVYQEKGLEDKQ
ncbi:High mobility group b protein, partial [Thalictrum thalictroides]